MRKLIVLIFTVLLVVSCGKLTREKEVNKQNLNGYDYRLFQKTPAWELAKAVWDNNPKKISTLVKNDSNLLNYREPIYGQTLLFLTMWHNQVKTFKFLLSLGANPNIYDTYDGSSPIIKACEKGFNNEFAMILLHHGANPSDVEIGKRRDDNHTRNSPLIVASESGNMNIVEMLVNAGATINYMNEYKQTALGGAVMLEHYDVVYYLLKKGANFKIPLYRTIPEDQPIYIENALQNMMPELNSEDYKIKMQIVEYLKQKGLIYKRVPVPENVLEKSKDRYPNDWQEYLEKY